MANREEHVYVERDGQHMIKRRVVEANPSTRQVIVNRVTQFLWLMASIIIILLGIRFGLMLIAANPTNDFAAFIYDVTSLFTRPFQTLVNSPATEGGSVFDVAAIFAMVITLVVAWAVTSLIRIVFSTAGGRRQVTTIERH